VAIGAAEAPQLVIFLALVVPRRMVRFGTLTLVTAQADSSALVVALAPNICRRHDFVM